jgi:hypothetical protein
MTKISFDLDFNKDSETLLKEIQDQAKAEVEKREGKERTKAYLSTLHQAVNEKVGTSFSSVTELVRALSDHVTPAMRERISGSTVIPAGRRKTVSMDRALYEQIKEALAKPSPNKAAIARKTNVSVVQVRKVAEGGYDDKFGASSAESPSSDSKSVELPTIDLPPVEAKEDKDASLPESSKPNSPPPFEVPEVESEPVIEELPEESPDPAEEDSAATSATEDGIYPDLPPPPSFNDESDGIPEISEEENVAPIPPPPSFDDDEAPVVSSLGIEEDGDGVLAPPLPPMSLEEPSHSVASPSLPPSLPPVEDSFAAEDEGSDAPTSAPPAPPAPSFDSDEPEESSEVEDVPLSPSSLPPIAEDLPSAPEPPAPPPSLGGEPAPPPSPPPSPSAPTMEPEADAATASPPLGKKLGLKLGGPSKKPTLKLGGKSGKVIKPTLNITRPPMAPKSSPPAPDA